MCLMNKHVIFKAGDEPQDQNWSYNMKSVDCAYDAASKGKHNQLSWCCEFVCLAGVNAHQSLACFTDFPRGSCQGAGQNLLCVLFTGAFMN